jgi:hypothetical protein
MNRWRNILFFAAVVAVNCARLPAGEVGPISGADVINAIKNGYSIVDAKVEGWKVTGKGTRSEMVLYEIAISDILLEGQSQISRQFTYNYGERPLLKRRRYIMILMPGPFVHAEPLDNDDRKDQIEMLVGR